MTGAADRRRRASASLLLALCLLLLLAPGPDQAAFDGVPVTNPVEVLAFLSLLPFVFDGVLRRWVGRRVVRLRRWAPPALALALASASAAKIVLAMTGGYGGFAACYRSAYDTPASACELSFDNPFQRFDATRLDPALDFGAGDWNFGFINSARFSIQPLPGSPLRDRLPFEVYWRGWVEVPPAATGLTLTYTGEAQLNLGSALHTLPRHYGVAATATVPVRAGGQAVAVHYRFDDGYRLGQDGPGTNATFRARLSDANGRDLGALTGTTRRRWLHVATRIVDVIVVGACGIAALLFLVAIRRSWLGVGIALTATAVIVRLPVMRPMPGKGTLLSLVSIGLLTWVLGRNRRRVRLAAFVSMAAVAAARASSMFPSFRSVLYRSAANDWLFYESQARTILATRSLEGGEPVFYFQPLYRYIKFLEHFVFGDGDALVTTFAVLALGVSTVWCASRAASKRADRHQMLWAGAAGAALLLTLNSPIATGMIRNGLSEYPAWTLLVLSCGLLASSRPARLATANLLLAVTGLIRTNDIPGLFVVATAIATRWRRRWFAAISILFFIVPIVVIILGHNVHYGGQWALLSATSRERDNVVITPSDAVRAATDAGVRSRIVEQFSWIAFVDGSQRVVRSWGPDQLLIHFPEARTGDAVPGAVLSLGMHALQALWLLAIVRVASRKELRTLRNFALLAAPAGLLAPFFVFRVTTYYPRNVMSGHLVMGLAAMWVGTAESEQRAPRPTDDGPTPESQSDLR